MGLFKVFAAAAKLRDNPRLRSHVKVGDDRDKTLTEVDVLLKNGTYALAAEVKS